MSKAEELQAQLDALKKDVLILVLMEVDL